MASSALLAQIQTNAADATTADQLAHVSEQMCSFIRRWIQVEDEEVRKLLFSKMDDTFIVVLNARRSRQYSPDDLFEAFCKGVKEYDHEMGPVMHIPASVYQKAYKAWAARHLPPRPKNRYGAPEPPTALSSSLAHPATRSAPVVPAPPPTSHPAAPPPTTKQKPQPIPKQPRPAVAMEGPKSSPTKFAKLAPPQPLTAAPPVFKAPLPVKSHDDSTVRPSAPPTTSRHASSTTTNRPPPPTGTEGRNRPSAPATTTKQQSSLPPIDVENHGPRNAKSTSMKSSKMAMPQDESEEDEELAVESMTREHERDPLKGKGKQRENVEEMGSNDEDMEREDKIVVAKTARRHKPRVIKSNAVIESETENDMESNDIGTTNEAKTKKPPSKRGKAKTRPKTPAATLHPPTDNSQQHDVPCIRCLDTGNHCFTTPTKSEDGSSDVTRRACDACYYSKAKCSFASELPHLLRNTATDKPWFNQMVRYLRCLYVPQVQEVRDIASVQDQLEELTKIVKTLPQRFKTQTEFLECKISNVAEHVETLSGKVAGFQESVNNALNKLDSAAEAAIADLRKHYEQGGEKPEVLEVAHPESPNLMPLEQEAPLNLELYPETPDAPLGTEPSLEAPVTQVETQSDVEGPILQSPHVHVDIPDHPMDIELPPLMNDDMDAGGHSGVGDTWTTNNAIDVATSLPSPLQDATSTLPSDLQVDTTVVPASPLGLLSATSPLTDDDMSD
ncbi:hypothetical protein CPC08DRAFT_769903 [Agrocybe pediades]|nr:hypothetical protein CPC08DRAFT_769903 [Agrocybe pediades]